jgi:hypothetical protein
MTIFVLKGYAGTERQQLFRLLLNLVEIDKNIPSSSNGRAAKVIANYSSKPALPPFIKKIYFRRRMLVGGCHLPPTKQTQNTILLLTKHR